MAEEKSLKESLLAASPFLIKIFEIILAVFSLGLVIAPFNNKLQSSVFRAGVIYSAYIGAILIDTLIIVSHFIGERIPKKPCLIVSAFFGIFMTLAAVMVIQDWRNIQTTIHLRPSKHHMDMMIASGIFSMFTSGTFLADFILTIKYG